MSERHEGGCQCGAVRYSFDGPVPPVYACHCGECKKQSSSAFSLGTGYDLELMDVTGKPAHFEVTAYSGATKYCYFCGSCGTRLWHSNSNPPRFITLKIGTLDDPSGIGKIGTLDDPSGIGPIAHLWVSKKLPGFQIDVDADQHQTQPDDLVSWRANLGKS